MCKVEHSLHSYFEARTLTSAGKGCKTHMDKHCRNSLLGQFIFLIHHNHRKIQESPGFAVRVPDPPVERQASTRYFACLSEASLRPHQQTSSDPSMPESQSDSFCHKDSKIPIDTDSNDDIRTLPC